MNFRKIIFWMHLVCGVVAGISIGIMCFTGTVLAFEKELAAWSERDARRVEPPSAEATRLPLQEIESRVRSAYPDARFSSIVVANDPAAAVAFPAGRGAPGYYVNPYTGEVRQPASTAVGRLMGTMVSWHRYLGLGGEVSRPRGKWINGVCNLAFCALAITGLYLWIPRNWSVRGVKAIALFNWRLTGKPRDFNWHNSIGLWSAPILIVLTLTAVPISFQWGGRLINTLTGTPQTATTRGRAPAPPPIEIPAPAPGAQPATPEALLAAVQQAVPDWKTITLRLSGGAAERSDADGQVAAALPAVSFTVRQAASWPRTANTTVTVDPYSAAILSRSGYAEMAAPQQVRAWTRFLHTGEAVGWVGQLIAGLASAGGCVLVWTGLALAWRRFFGKA